MDENWIMDLEIWLFLITVKLFSIHSVLNKLLWKIKRGTKNEQN